ncbi:MAG: 2-oxoacid:ferredoxin oxidoreductase subunit beta [Planctomycetes bacterium]|nr:2-oxoacid:ferredoxin oxidoreductase subunit beta [Planctomycetota bacterium]
MSESATAQKTNRVGLTKEDYGGAPSTMCKGCGHDRISEAVIQAAFHLGVESHRIVKMSGIGCSSKTPAYFLGRTFGLNATHGRMPSFATGSYVANSALMPLGVSGDGDTASIGIGQFVHLVRRNPKMVYIVENNGVYGLTKGQFSATADRESPSKRGALPSEGPIDLCSLALDLGCSFVARSFSGDKKQLVPLIEAAFSHNGLAFLDVISPCVTFNNHDESTKSYTYHKDHEVHYHDVTFVPHFEHIDVEYEPGSVQTVPLHDGSKLHLKKLDAAYDPTDFQRAAHALRETRANRQILTGLIYINKGTPTFAETLKLPATPLASLDEKTLRPSREALDKFNAAHRV